MKSIIKIENLGTFVPKNSHVNAYSEPSKIKIYYDSCEDDEDVIWIDTYGQTRIVAKNTFKSTLLSNKIIVKNFDEGFEMYLKAIDEE